ncbi:MAG: hypothetical protein HFI47_11155 [Lachnospiraceae bacterium]|jgi:CHASE3 domain sensor protein|nr:hypothetical protein [Lachnospiraceae bacterium]
MARGQRKPIEQKIEEKQKVIDSLEIRIEKEREELQELLNEQKWAKLEEIGAIIESSNLSMEEVEKILSEHASHVA